MKISIDSKKFLPHQLAWWQLPNFIKLLVGGFGSGKTFIGVLRAIYLSYIHRPLPGLLVSPTYKMAKRTIIPTLNEIINKSGLMVTHNKTDNEYIIHNWNGHFWLGSGDDPDSLRGPNLRWVGIDEPFIQDKMVLDIALSRIRPVTEETELFLTGTPEQLNWGYDLAMNDEKMYDVGYVVGKTKDNIHTGEAYYKTLESAYTPEMREAYLEGKFVNLRLGRAYKPFSRDRHIKHLNVDMLEVCAGIDFNVDYMTAEVFALGNGYVHFIDEIRKSYSNTFELADELRSKYPNIRVFPDPTGSGRRSSATKSDHQILRDAGFRVMFRKQVPVMDRVNAVNSMLNQDRLTIEPGKCDWLVKDLERVVFKSGDLDKTTEVELTHASDAAGYPIEYNFPVRKRTIEQIRI